MEKVCEFCASLRPVVFCKADEAYLCLSCDSNVHLANPLSGRHLRTLLCDSCIYHLAYVQCLEHKMLLCRGCDQKLHDLSVGHQKRAIRSYMGCPSAKDFATLWGFEFSEVENGSHQGQFASISHGSADSNLVHVSGQPVFQTGAPSFVSKGKFEGGTGGQQGQILCRDQKRKTILQQIIDLRRLQLSQKSNHSLKINEQQETDLSSSISHVLKKFDENIDQQAQNSQDFATKLPQKDSYMEELKPETLSSTLSQLDNLTSSPIIDLPLDGELFWTCKSPIQNNQLWSQNIQDLGICEELTCQDDFNIPDVDLTFQNFEELFGGDQDPIKGGLLGDKDVSYSSIEKDMSLDKSDIDNTSMMEDASVAACVTVSQSAHEDRDKILPSISFSVSGFSADSSGIYHYGNAISTCAEGKGNSSSSLELEGSYVEARRNDTVKYKEKKKSQLHEKQVRLPSMKAGAKVRKRVKGQYSKAESY